MKRKNTKTNMLLLIVAVFYFAVPHFAEDLKDRPDSVNYIFGLNVNDNVLEELPGKGITKFKLYTTSNQSAIVWKFRKNYYVYTINGGDHVISAIELLKRIKVHGIATFVANKDGNSLRFNKYHKVIAMRVGSMD
jgi:hypothetical protein